MTLTFAAAHPQETSFPMMQADLVRPSDFLLIPAVHVPLAHNQKLDAYNFFNIQWSSNSLNKIHKPTVTPDLEHVLPSELRRGLTVGIVTSPYELVTVRFQGINTVLDFLADLFSPIHTFSVKGEKRLEPHQS